jgi:XRE family transcriptional regulator, regulator of sulfur utilization
MKSMNETVAANIRRLREEKKLSMDELARLSGVSKSMLSQIEHSEGNPTLSTLCKIANGMNVPFDALTVRSKQDFEIIRLTDLQPFTEDNGKARNYSVFPDAENRRFSIYYLEVESGAFWNAEPHLRGTVEFITVVSGRLEMTASGQINYVDKGESIQIKTDMPHSYKNVSNELAKLHMVIFTP